MSTPTALHTRRIDAPAWQRLLAEGAPQVLGAMAPGLDLAASPAQRLAADRDHTGLPVAALPTPVLAPATPLLDLWCTPGQLQRGRSGALRFSDNGHWLFGVLDLPETPEQAEGLATTAHQAYLQLFALLRSRGYVHLQRVWNYLPRINHAAQGLERYRQFNIGRQQAFIDAGHDAFEGAPAACGIGTPGAGDATLHLRFLAGRQAPVPVENPRQVPAYRYPSAYGPRAPTFSRAAWVAAGGGQRALMVSGTASIVGHTSLHDGDVRAQTRETLANLQALLQAAHERQPGPQPPQLAQLCSTVYLRHAEHLAPVREELQRALGADAPAVAQAVFLQADICRAELLVEIEGHLWLPA